MPAVRPLVVAAVSAVALMASARDASAEFSEPRPARPVPYLLRGYSDITKDYTKSVSNGDFGASLQIYAKSQRKSYEAMCQSADPARYCATLGGFDFLFCAAVAKQIQDTTCSKRGEALAAAGYAGVDVTIFGKNIDLFDLGASANVEPEGASTEWGISVGGKKIFGKKSGTQITYYQPVAERSLAKASTTLMVGPVPVTVTADAVGSLGLDFALSAGSGAVKGSVTPSAAINGVLSAGVGVSGCSVGVYGDILLAKLSTPAAAQISLDPQMGYRYTTSLDLVVNALDGDAGAYAEFAIWRKEWSFIDWNGLEYKKNLGSASGYL